MQVKCFVCCALQAMKTQGEMVGGELYGSKPPLRCCVIVSSSCCCLVAIYRLHKFEVTVHHTLTATVAMCTRHAWDRSPTRRCVCRRISRRVSPWLYPSLLMSKWWRRWTTSHLVETSTHRSMPIYHFPTWQQTSQGGRTRTFGSPPSTLRQHPPSSVVLPQSTTGTWPPQVERLR